MIMKRILILAFIISYAPPTSAPVETPKSAPRNPVLPAAVDSAELLRADLNRIFSDSAFARAQWGVKVFSLDRSEILYERDSLRLYIPASNNKIVTAAVALMRLGPEFRFETQVLTDGNIAEGVLHGNLIIVSSGDPSNAPRFQSGDPFAIFRNWAAKLKELGVRAISGDIIGDGKAFDENKLGHGWEWEDLAYAYAAPVSAMQFNENMLSLHIAPGAEMGGSASIKIFPLESFLKIDNRVVTQAQGIPPRIQIRRGSSNERVSVYGSIPLKAAGIIRNIAVPYPTRYYLSALKHVLSEEGIDTSLCGIKEMRVFKAPSFTLLWTHSSPALSEILKPLLKESQNLYAETLTRALGLVLSGKGTFSKGKEIVEQTLGQIGIEPETYSYADGSGLSRLNLASADVLVRILISMHQHRYFVHFYEALSIAGLDGTLAERMKGTKAENNLHAKTGSIANASAISGYIDTADGETLAFSIMANNFLEYKNRVEFLQNKAIERLADFSRSGAIK